MEIINEEIKKKFSNKGITLIALVITIIVMLILAGITITTLTGDNGLLQKAENAKQENEEVKELELIKLAVSSAQVAGEGILTTDNLNNELYANFGDTETVNRIGYNWYYKGYIIDEKGKVEKNDKLLPKEYQQVEYIESTETQYIDTKCFCDNNTRLEIWVEGLVKEANIAIVDKYGICFNDRFRCWFGDNNDQWSDIAVELNKKYYHRLDRTGYYIDERKVCNFGEKNNFTTSRTLTLLSYNGRFIRKCRLYKCQISQNEELTRCFIPCYSNLTVTDVSGKECPEGTIGMYDLVEGKFYTNQGTGEFLKGADV